MYLIIPTMLANQPGEMLTTTTVAQPSLSISGSNGRFTHAPVMPDESTLIVAVHDTPAVLAKRTLVVADEAWDCSYWNPADGDWGPNEDELMKMGYPHCYPYGRPGRPGQPPKPDKSTLPETPDVFQMPQFPHVMPDLWPSPAASDIPAMPPMPDVPAVPRIPHFPVTGSSPDLPALPPVSHMPAMARRAAMPGFPAVPRMPDSPAMPKMPGMPRMPGMPQMPQMPEMPGLPLITDMPAMILRAAMPSVDVDGAPETHGHGAVVLGEPASNMAAPSELPNINPEWLWRHGFGPVVASVRISPTLVTSISGNPTATAASASASASVNTSNRVMPTRPTASAADLPLVLEPGPVIPTGSAFEAFITGLAVTPAASRSTGTVEAATTGQVRTWEPPYFGQGPAIFPTRLDEWMLPAARSLNEQGEKNRAVSDVSSGCATATAQPSGSATQASGSGNALMTAILNWIMSDSRTRADRAKAAEAKPCEHQ